jgi:beta-lactamase class A
MQTTLLPLAPAATPSTIPPTNTPPITTPQPTFPAEQLQAILDEAGGTFGVVVSDVQYDQVVYTQHQDDSFSAASLIKLPIAVAVYQVVSQGAGSLDDELVMQAEDVVGGTGSLQYAAVGTAYPVRELCARMLYDSDNTAANMLIDYLGGFAVVNTTMQQLGATETVLQRYLMDLEAIQAGRDNLTSPADMHLLLQLLANGAIVGADDLLLALQQTTDTQKIPALLPNDGSVTIYHKIGTLTGVEHDVGIGQTAQGNRYIVVFMSNGLASNEAGITAIAKASQLVYEYFMQSWQSSAADDTDTSGANAPQPTPQPAPPHYVFPVQADGATYGPYHHDYPATDIFCPIGSPFLATTAGVVDFVNALDLWDAATDVPADRGGIMLAIVGDDGWRYYGSHLSGVAAGIEVGVRVTAGQLLGWTGNSGNARWTDPHLHYGISRPTFPEDWQTRRGEISPYVSLQAWQRGEQRTPQRDD